MTRKEMIDLINEECETWLDVIELFKFGRLNNWFVAYDGPSVEEAYLTNVHPLSDESGELITDNDFNNKGGK